MPYLRTRFTQHCRYVKSDNPKLSYASHILNNNHEFGPANNTIKLIQQWGEKQKPIYNNKKLVQEQTPEEYNVLYDLSTYNQYACTDRPNSNT
jgi:hypothetical protein